MEGLGHLGHLVLRASLGYVQETYTKVLGFKVSGLGSKVSHLRSKVWGLRFRIRFKG